MNMCIGTIKMIFIIGLLALLINHDDDEREYQYNVKERAE